VWHTHLDVFLIFRRAIAGERGSIVGKLDDDVAGTRTTFRNVELAATYQKAAAVLLANQLARLEPRLTELSAAQ